MFLLNTDMLVYAFEIEAVRDPVSVLPLDHWNCNIRGDHLCVCICVQGCYQELGLGVWW